MPLRVALGQVDARVGDVGGNVARVLAAWEGAARHGADLVVFTELTVTGYPPEDLLLKREFVEANLAAVRRLATEGPTGTVAVVGHVGAGEEPDLGDAADGGRVEHGGSPHDAGAAGGGDAIGPATLAGADHWDVALATRALTNSASVLADGAILATYDKLRLPNYGVFDEARYFTPRSRPCVVDVAGWSVGVTICEDLWSEEGPAAAALAAGAEVLVSLNASPYHRGKRADRQGWAAHHARRGAAHVLYCNVVGGQDEVVFDGDSLVVGPDGGVLARGAQFREDLVVIDLARDPDEPGRSITGPEPAARAMGWSAGPRPPLEPPSLPPEPDPVGEVWAALVRATGDYCRHNGFSRALVGLSGGIDSAVTAAIAVEALGPEGVLGVAMPSPYSSDHSVRDARKLAANLGCTYHELPIGGPLAAMGELLGELVVTGFDRADGRRPGVAYENLQARLRGVALMTLSNELGAIVLTTGNKSEYAVGYATLYGDMAGGFAPLKDVSKLLVYDLARWCNRNGEVVPTATIDKPPSAELRPGQLDGDSLPDYAVLDDIVTAYVELDLGLDQIRARGHDPEEVARVVGLVDRAEFKRRQAAPGPKITERAFGRDRRVPITNLWRG